MMMFDLQWLPKAVLQQLKFLLTFTKSLSSGNVSTNLKTAKVIPLFESWDGFVIIALSLSLHAFEKFFKVWCIIKCLSIREKSNFYEYQHRLTKKHSTYMAVIQQVGSIHSALQMALKLYH